MLRPTGTGGNFDAEHAAGRPRALADQVAVVPG